MVAGLKTIWKERNNETFRNLREILQGHHQLDQH